MTAQGAELWDAHLYRLRATPSHENDMLAFGSTTFMAYRFGAALVGDELVDQLIELKGETEVRQADLPLRNLFLPTIDALEHVGDRLCAGGLGTVLAMADEGRFVIPLQVRSSRVADGGGTQAVIPKAFHQATVGSPEEVKPYWTVLREQYEECFGGQEVERDSPSMVFNAYLRASQPIAYIHEHRGAAEILYHGLALNAFNGNYEFATSIVVLDEWFWRTLAEVSRPNWEGKWFLLHTDDPAKMREALTSPNLVNESRFHLAEGLLHLRAKYPEMVADIGLRHRLNLSACGAA